MTASMNILMYHSISSASGPTSIPRDTFRRQIEMLAVCGYESISLSAFNDWRTDKRAAKARSVVITFDDGFADFAESAFEILRAHSYTATVFLPSGKIGGIEDWDGNRSLGRRLMSWSQVLDLSKENIQFGGHSVTHADLTALSSNELEREVRQCRDQIGEKLGCLPVGFAPPYGRSHERERREIRNSFDVSVGTRLARAYPDCDPYDVPRIEMHYFRNVNRWREYLEGRADWYLNARRALRSVKNLVTV